jgi:flagellar hook-length control protein FliK
VEEQGVLGAAEPRVREQLPIEQLVQRVIENTANNSGGKTASEIAALIGSVMHAGGDETTGISVVSPMTVEEQGVLGAAEPRVREQLPIERLVQRVIENTANNSGGKTASEIAAVLGFAIDREGMGGTKVNGLPPVAENGNLIPGSVNIVRNGDGSQNNANVKNQPDAATFTSKSWLESMADKGIDMKNHVAAGQTSITDTPPPEPLRGNLLSESNDALAMSKTMPDQLVAGAGEKMKSAVDQQPHDNVPTFLGDASGQKNVAAKMVFSHSQATLDQQPVGQKSQINISLPLGLSELSSGERHNMQVDVNTAGENQFSGLPLPGLEPAVSKGENHLPVTSDDLLNQVTMRLPDRHDSRQVVTIQLQPESLGKVEIKLVMEQQKLSAHFVVQHSEVRDVLLKHVSSLHDALMVKGVEVKQVAVEIAPAEKMAGMSVTVDQHSAGGNQTNSFQQFSSGGEPRHHDFSAQDESTIQSVKAEELHVLAGLPSSEFFLQPGSLHIRA